VTDTPFSNTARFGTHFTDKGTVLGISQPTHRKVEGIIAASSTQPRVQMKVELPFTKASFDENAQAKFKSAVANAVTTPADNIFIKSVTEVTSSRRVSRKLLAVSVQVDFYILVYNEAASKAMVSSGNLDISKLNSELAQQVFPNQTASSGRHFARVRHFQKSALHPPARGREHERGSLRARVLTLTASCPLFIQTGPPPHLQGPHEAGDCYHGGGHNTHASFTVCSLCGAGAGPPGVCRDLGYTADDEILRRFVEISLFFQ
jgi:hypothetical protein